MSNQPDIGWCPCCKRAVVEMPAGSCSDCSNHTMNLMSTYDHEEELAATKQKLEAAEQAIRDEVAAEVWGEAEKMCESVGDDYERREGRKYPELRSDAFTGAQSCASVAREKAAELRAYKVKGD